MKTIPNIDATSPDVVVGRHSLWAPKLGVKVPFQFGGRVTKYGHAEADYAVADVLPNEVAILGGLAAEGMAPPVGEYVYVETLTSMHPGGLHVDPVGAFGYAMADATKLPPGRFSVEAMRKLPIEGSPGAWNDISVVGRDNVINGYLVDVARSRFDSLRWAGAGLAPLTRRPIEDVAALSADLHRLTQFPHRERELAYQDFWLAGEWRRGQRRVVERADLLGFAPNPGETVLEVGCQSGGFLQLAWQRMEGRGTVLGVELEQDYVDCARRLARHAGYNLCIRRLDAVAERADLIRWTKARAPKGLDHLLLLSMEKHLGIPETFALVDAIGARVTYIETNADKGAPGKPGKLWPEVRARGGVYVGDSTDRNMRRLYRIERT